MADTSATIIAASLSDDELRKSVNKLVSYFDDQMKIMAVSANITVDSIEKKLKSLGNIKIDSGGSADSGSSKRTSSLKQEEQQVKSVATSYDGLAKAQQNAIGSRGGSALKKDIDDAANSYSGLIRQIERTQAKFDISPIQSLRMRQHELEAGMQTAANEAAKAKKDVDELNAAIANYRTTLETLPKNGQGFSNRQAIQKEINDLITLRDVSSAEQQKWEAASRQLASQYEVVKNEIRQIGQALIAAEESEKHVTTELDKQLQKINEISSRKTATQTYRDAISMETNSLEKAESKLAVLQALKTKILNTDLLSKKDTESLTYYISYTTALVERMRSKTAKSTKDDEDAIRKAAEAEKKWADNIVARGQIAQETSRKLIRMLNEEAQAGGKGLMGMYKIDGKDISAAKELEKAIKDMRMQYNQMSDMDKDSAIGRALKRDIENALKASGIVSAYNKMALGVNSNTNNSETAKIRNYETLKNILKELTSQYNQVSIAEIKAGNANHIIDAIQRTSREAQQLQSIMNRPTSFAAAMKLSEKTLDDLSYKIRQLQSYKIGIDLQNPNAANEIKQVDEAILRLQKDMDKYMAKANGVLSSNNALGRSWNYMKNRLAFYFSVGASTQFIKNLIEVRSQYEMNERALGILINSAERGTQIFNELSQMALVSPYTLIELSSAAKQLTAYDVAARDVVDTTRRLADMAAAVGIPIERLTYALGQIKAYGYLNSRDARMFANAGIPLVKQLSEYYTELEGRLVSTADVYDRIKKKSIDYNEVMEVMYKMTDQGGKFFDFQAKMADTLKVRLANLTLAWNNMLNDMGKESQGVLTWGIGALRDLFLRWKDLDKAIKNAAWIVGLKVALDLLLFGLNRAGLALGMWTHKMAFSEVVGKRLAATITTIGRSLYSLASSRMTWITLAVMATIELINALKGANEAQKALNESIRNGAKDNYNNISKFLGQYQEVRDSLYAANVKGIHRVFADNLGKTVTADKDNYLVPETQIKDIDNNEAKKAWEAIREQIELTVASSDKYIGNLLSISNMSERVRQGFNLLDDVQVVNAALKELDDDTIKVSKDLSAWWNAWQAPDGLIGNLKDYQKTLNDIIAEYGTLESFRENTFLGGKGSDDLNDYQTALERFRDDLQKTTDSIINFIELKGWSGDEGKINQVFEQITQKLVLDNQLDPQKAFTLQTEVEEARSNAAKKALLQRINDEREAYKISQDETVRQAINADVERYNHWEETNGRSKVEWERFTKWLKEQHISETTAMFRNMDAEDIKSLNFQEGKHAEWVTRMVTQYAKEHKMSYDEAFNYLKSWVKSANQWSIFIPLTISTEDKKSVYDQLGEYDKAIDAADSEIERLTTRIDELRKKKELDKDETDELTRAEQELADARKAKADAESKGGHGKKEKKDERASQKAAKQAESELAKALKDELSTIEKVRSIYKELTKEGASHADAVKSATEGWEETVNAINRVLTKNGLKGLNLNDFVGVENPREILKTLQAQLDAMVKRGAKPAEIQVLQEKIKTIKVDAEKYDLTKITKGLNNELDRLKEEYELAVALDADPELGGIFANWMGIDMNELPRTASEYAKQYTDILNKKLKEYNANIKLPNLLNITDDDLREFESRVGTDGITQKYVDDIIKGVKAVREVFRKEKEDTSKDWNALIEKYGGLQAKLLKIYKDNVQQQASIVREFGTNEEQVNALDLVSKIKISQDPEEIARLQEELAKVMNDVTSRNPVALKTYQAVRNEQESQTSKTYWDDFKNSDLYSMTFTDMANNSTLAIQMIIDKLNELKDKVDEDPASMKALIKSLEDAESELLSRNPFAGIVNGINDWINASRELQVAEDKLKQANIEVAGSEIALKNAQSVGDKNAILAAEQKLARAQEKQAESQKKVVSTSNNAKKALSNLSKSMNEMANTIQDMGSLLSTVSKLLRFAGADDAADAIDAINEGFTAMVTVIMAVDAAIKLVTSTNPYLLAIAAALSIIVGLVSFLSGNSNKKITEQVEASERAVKRLELAYVDLQQAVDKAYGTATIGAKQATLANKELQLAEIQRQIQLEKSRSGKNRDEDKIIDLQKQYKELFYEIKNGYTEIVDDLMGTDVASFAENLVSSMIDAFKQGEDYMKVFSDKFDEMIDNMIMKSIVSRVVSQYLDAIWSDLDERINERAHEESVEYAKKKNEATRIEGMTDKEIEKEIFGDFSVLSKELNFALENAEDALSGSLNPAEYALKRQEFIQQKIDEYRAAAKEEEKAAKERLDAASMFTDSDIGYVIGKFGEIMPELGEKLKNILGEYYKFGESSETQLSALQQGISQISEQTAGALEAYANSISQQAYLRNDLLTQIRDTVMSFDMDIQLGVFSQMLLQLQNNYIIMQSMQSMMEGWTTPSGQGIRVELIS